MEYLDFEVETPAARLLGILAEGLIWGVLFVIFAENGLNKLFEAFLKQQGVYKKLKEEKGWMGASIADDLIVMFGFGLQHFFAGGMLLMGALTGDLSLVRHGLMCEWGWEFKDYLNLITRTGPYKDGSVSESFRNSAKFHHLPGIICAPPLIYFGLNANEHVQNIGAIMILGGGIGVLSNLLRLLFKHGYDAREKLMFAFGAMDVFVFFGFNRFVIFPIEVFRLIRDLVEMEQHIVAVVVFAGFALMLRFNVTVWKLKADKLFAAPKSTEHVAKQPGNGGQPKMLKRASSSIHPVLGDVDD